MYLIAITVFTCLKPPDFKTKEPVNDVCRTVGENWYPAPQLQIQTWKHSVIQLLHSDIQEFVWVSWVEDIYIIYMEIIF